MVEGVGPEAETIVNAAGGKQSHTPYRVDLLPPKAILHVSRILAEGAAKYGEWNWQKVPFQDNINHALVHLMAESAGDTSDDHMGHGVCRLLFALEQYIEHHERQAVKPKVFGFARGVEG